MKTIRPAIDIRQVDRSQDPVLRNLFEHYLHDMAEWFQFDYGPEGSFSYATEAYWDNGVEAYFAYVGTIPVGFGLVGSAAAFTGDADAKDLDEFFVARRYRRNGLGRELANHLWNAYPGRWLVRVFQGNLPALPFWRGAIAEYTNGAYREEVRTVRERQWSYFTFDNSARGVEIR